jgi:hypothetical protein
VVFEVTTSFSIGHGHPAGTTGQMEKNVDRWKPFPKPIQVVLAVYFLASLLHFAHNAEFIAFYPNMPPWLTREKVYLAWLAISSVSVLAVVLSRFGWRCLGAVFLAFYGALGLDGLAHYSLALCSEHTLLTNITIWFEAVSGLVLLLASSVLAVRAFAARPHASGVA